MTAIELRGVDSDPVLLELQYAQESPGNLVKMQIQRFRISDKGPGDVTAAGQRNLA